MVHNFADGQAKSFQQRTTSLQSIKFQGKQNRCSDRVAATLRQLNIAVFAKQPLVRFCLMLWTAPPDGITMCHIGAV